jgi:hypothetical protein
MSFCVTISGVDNAIGKMIYDQWKFYRGVYAQISTIDDEPMMPCRCGKTVMVGKVAEDILENILMEDIQFDNCNMLVKSVKIKDEDVDDTEEWYMTEYEFREWYFTHSHKYTMAFYNFFMEDYGNFRKIAPQVVEKELYKLWKDNPVLFTDMVIEFEDEDENEYTFA